MYVVCKVYEYDTYIDLKDLKSSQFIRALDAARMRESNSTWRYYRGSKLTRLLFGAKDGN